MTARDDFTASVDGAAGFERQRALSTGDYDEPERPDWSEAEDFECAACERPIAGIPYRDEEAVAWLRDQAPTCCDAECCADAAERAASC